MVKSLLCVYAIIFVTKMGYFPIKVLSMKYLRLLFLISIIFQGLSSSEEISQIARELNLYGGQKATIQWKRIFSSPRHLKRYKLDTLSISTRLELKKYLIKHSADSEQPIVPGL